MAFSAAALLQGTVQVAFSNFWPDLVEWEDEKNKLSDLFQQSLSRRGQISGLQDIYQPERK